MEWIPLLNIIWDVYRFFSPAALDPAWWEYLVHIAETVAVAQAVIMLGVWDKVVAMTATTVDDTYLRKARAALAQAVKIILAVSALNPKLGLRVAKVFKAEQAPSRQA